MRRPCVWPVISHMVGGQLCPCSQSSQNVHSGLHLQASIVDQARRNEPTLHGRSFSSDGKRRCVRHMSDRHDHACTIKSAMGEWLDHKDGITQDQRFALLFEHAKKRSGRQVLVDFTLSICVGEREI